MEAASFGSTVDKYITTTLPEILRERLGNDFIITRCTVQPQVGLPCEKNLTFNIFEGLLNYVWDLREMEEVLASLNSGDFGPALKKFYPNEDASTIDLGDFSKRLLASMTEEKKKHTGGRGIQLVQEKVAEAVAIAFQRAGRGNRILAQVITEIAFCKLGNLWEEAPIKLEEDFLRYCNSCFKMRSTEKKLNRCVCLKTFYCNSECQKADLSKHKRICYQRRGLTFCNSCLKLQSSDQKLSKCARCFAISYCSKECQTKDWSGHKIVCKPSKK